MRVLHVVRNLSLKANYIKHFPLSRNKNVLARFLCNFPRTENNREDPN